MEFLHTLKNENARKIALGYIIFTGICILGLIAVAVINKHITGVMSADIYIPIHTVLEFTSIVVSFAVFVIGWYGYKQTQNRQDLFIAVAFMTVSAFDFVHTMSYKGMLPFLGANTVGKAAAYWLVARLLSSIALFLAAFISPSTKSKLITPRMLLPVAGVIFASVVFLFTVYSSAVSNLMYRTGSGLTSFKIVLEYLVVAIYIAAFAVLGRVKVWRMYSVTYLRYAIIFAISSEICFTLYQSAFDTNNLLGHIYKVVAYYLVLQGLFVSSLHRPYSELSYLKYQLQNSFRSVGEALGSGFQKDTTLKQIASLARQMFDADMAAIGELRHDGVIEVATFDGLDPGILRVPVQQSLAGEAFVSSEPLVVDDIASRKRTRPEFIAIGLHSLMWAPIERDGRPVGVIYIGSFDIGRFNQEDAEILTGFAGHAANALGNAEHYEREHRIADALQHVIFPPSSLEFGDFKVSGKYQPAWDEAQVGGDFYDYFDIGDGRFGIAIGDVSGKGLGAAVHTAIVKYSYQAYVREGFSPAEALKRVGEAFEEHEIRADVPDSIFITLFCGILDTKTGRLVYANAGHEPPIKVASNTEVTTLDVTGPILGLGGGRFDEKEISLDEGDMLVLYTDGITEARTAGRLFGQEGLINAVQSCQDCSIDELADYICKRANSHANGIIQDDVALIVIKRGTRSS